MKNIFTKRVRTAVAALALGLLALPAQAQTFSQMSPYDTITATPTTLYWDILNPTTGVAGNASLTVYYDGDFGASVEYITIFGENNYQIGVTLPHFDGTDCMLDSVTLSIPGYLVNSWAADNIISFYGVTTSNVDYFCTTNHARVKLTYNYCPSGQVAAISMPVTSFCGIDNAVAITTSPAGGTLTGTGISGNMFDPQGLFPGNYMITYNYTDTAGCASAATVIATIKEGPVAFTQNDTICPYNTALLAASTSGHIIWYSDAALTTVVDTGYTVITAPLMTTTTFYASTTLIDTYFMIDTLGTLDSAVVDHDAITGDDRGGIAVTQNYVYIVGDNNTGRYDLDLQNGVSYPRADGIFSDLGTGQLYTLYNPIVGIPDAANIDSFYITEIRTLNDDITLGTTVIALTDSIPFGYNNNYDISGVFAGNGFVIVYSSSTMHWYVIDLQDGVVTDLGASGYPNFYWSENWSVWGVAEFNGNNYSVLYRNDNDGNIHRMDLSSFTSASVFAYNDLSDMASFTYAPWNNRWYFHYEGSGQFGGSSETLGYATAADSTGSEMIGTTIACPAAVTVFVDVCTAIEEHSSALVSISPNPNNGIFTISIANITDAQVDIIGMDGRLVYSERFTGPANQKNVDLSSVASGVYYVRVSSSDVVKTAKLIKQ